VALSRVTRYGGAALVTLALVVAAAVGWLKLHEDQLVFAADRSRLHLIDALPETAARVSIQLAGGLELAGLAYRADPSNDTGYFILHLHGNADSAFTPEQLRHCEALRGAGFGVLDIDYRGFGRSPGVPSEANMYEDAEAGYQELVRLGAAPTRIVVLGHSLGSGPAVLLATHHSIAALVLFGAFTSIPDAAAARYPLLPVRYVASIKFNSLARIAAVHVPVIIAHSRTDTLIPYDHALRLYRAANDPKRLLTFTAPRDDGFGGHVDALFDNVPELKSALLALLPR
jgi:uncharacterized protein